MLRQALRELLDRDGVDPDAFSLDGATGEQRLTLEVEPGGWCLYFAWWQRITYGTTAWRISMGRRQVVESVNAALKGVFTDLGRGYLRVMGVTRMTILLGFTLAAFNLDRIRSFRAKHHLDETGKPTGEKPKQTRKPRRTGTWADVIEGEAPPG